MMKGFFEKLKNKNGESLVESIVSILIFSLASVLLLTMVSTSAKLNEKALKQDKDISHQLYVAEAQEKEDRHESKIKVQTGENIESAEEIPVYYFSADEGALYSFEFKK